MLRYIYFKSLKPLSTKYLKIYFIYYLLYLITFKLRKVLKTLGASEHPVCDVRHWYFVNVPEPFVYCD